MFANKTILITGARRGIGYHLANEFSKLGSFVIDFSKNDNNNKNIDYAVTVDISNADEVKSAFKNLKTKNLIPDVVINNASVLSIDHFMLMKPEKALDMININFYGTFLVTKEAAKIMRNKKKGRIVNITSIAKHLKPEGDAIYASTKSAVETFGMIVAKELKGTGITCNSVGVSAIETEMMQKISKSLNSKK